MRKGQKCSEETKAKLRAANLGKKHTEESKRLMSASHKGQIAWNKGIPCSEETKKVLSAKNKGRPHTEEAERLISSKKKGRRPSKETREKISRANIKRIQEHGPSWLEGFVYGVHYESSYEKAGIEFFHKRGWKVKRCGDPIPYFFGGYPLFGAYCI